MVEGGTRLAGEHRRRIDRLDGNAGGVSDGVGRRRFGEVRLVGGRCGRRTAQVGGVARVSC